MCGIAGIFRNNNKSVSIVEIKKMTDAIVHRGPDAEGHWLSDKQSIGFGHRRLAIIDLSEGGAQPKSFKNNLTITFNGEIYNYLELRELLLSKEYKFETESDTEVLLALYDFYGENCLEHIDGMFAFSIWDEKNQELFCARDRVGEKPFFYYWNGVEFIFASEIKAILEVVGNVGIDLIKLQEFINDGQVKSNKQSFFNSIQVLPPASKIKVKNKKIEIEKYWVIDLNNKLSSISDAAAMSKFQDLFFSSIERRMRMDVKFGTSLSGGLDSSSIASAISSRSNMPLKTFSARFEGPLDEGKWMNEVIKKFNLENEVVYPKFDEMLKKLSKLTYHQEYPIAGSSMFAQWCVMELVKKNGVTVLIDGQGADEFLCGYKEFKYFAIWDLFYQGKFAQFFKERKLFNKYFGENEKIGWGFVLYPIRKYFGRKPVEWEFGTSLKERLKYAVENDLSNLLMSADRNSMAHSIEIRLPFTNKELIEFAINLPNRLLYNNSETKSILRKSMKGILPDSIINRKDKIGFAPPQSIWLTSNDGKKEVEKAEHLLKQFNLQPNKKWPWRSIAAANFITTFSN